MGKVDVHLFHGFFGLPRDWDGVIDSFSNAEGVKFFKHDLWNDLNYIDKVTFENWAQYKNESFNDRSIKKVAIGYSLGGRLVMNLNLAEFDKVLFLSAHPGLRILTQKHQRLASDLEWGARFLTMDWLLLKSYWNKQDVFSGDKNRPERKEKDFEREKLSVSLQEFSLSQQKTKDEYLSTMKGKIFWACGDKDAKFMQLQDRIKKTIGENSVFTIDDSGHGCLFDQPKSVAQLIERFV